MCRLALQSFSNSQEPRWSIHRKQIQPTGWKSDAERVSQPFSSPFLARAIWVGGIPKKRNGKPGSTWACTKATGSRKTLGQFIPSPYALLELPKKPLWVVPEQGAEEREDS